MRSTAGSLLAPAASLARSRLKAILVVDADSAMIQAAESGLGIAFVYQSLVTQQLSAGSLVHLLPDYRYPADHFCVYYPSRKHIPAPPAGLYRLGDGAE